jgi:hypothetical protein
MQEKISPSDNFFARRGTRGVFRGNDGAARAQRPLREKGP